MRCVTSRKQLIIQQIRMRLAGRMTLEQAFAETRGFEYLRLAELQSLLARRSNTPIRFDAGLMKASRRQLHEDKFTK